MGEVFLLRPHVLLRRICLDPVVPAGAGTGHRGIDDLFLRQPGPDVRLDEVEVEPAGDNLAKFVLDLGNRGLAGKVVPLAGIALDVEKLRRGAVDVGVFSRPFADHEAGPHDRLTVIFGNHRYGLKCAAMERGHKAAAVEFANRHGAGDVDQSCWQIDQ